MPRYETKKHLLQAPGYKQKSLSLPFAPAWKSWIMTSEADWVCAVAAGKHVHINVVSDNLSVSYIACCGWTTNLEITLASKTS